MSIESIWNRVADVNDHYSISQDELLFILEHAVTLPPEPTILELGVCHGRTFAALTLVAMALRGRVYGIDHFGLEGSPLEVQEMMSGHQLTNWNLLVSDTRHVTWDKPLDLLVIDAGHDEVNVGQDAIRYVPFVRSGGLVFWDDFEPTLDRRSPHWAVHFYAMQACEGWIDLGQVEGMKGFRRP